MSEFKKIRPAYCLHIPTGITIFYSLLEQKCAEDAVTDERNMVYALSRVLKTIARDAEYEYNIDLPEKERVHKMLNWTFYDSSVDSTLKP